ncbi:hypothetical protein [Caenispirillum bisanense]|uniref:Uncharacterized protein n=1 Tax=Caenispirillum bisanense TaxID=414052 RepID=A0A286GNV1_9PROT|nr:hypothetical protein [Caenispirillum bisanense]SOD97217.1 hypothetical protein SAMN05421508_106336 [Caenispirillum bisanense]
MTSTAGADACSQRQWAEKKLLLLQKDQYQQAEYNLSSPRLLSGIEHVSLLHPDGGSGGAALAVRTDKWRERLVPVEDLRDEVENVVGGTDIFVSQQSFLGWRRVSQLLTLGACYVDLDYFHMPSLAHSTPEAVTQDVLRSLVDSNIPEPSYILFTGRGLLVTWLIDAIPRAALPRWQVVQRYLADALAGHCSDRRALDAARVFRLAGSVNSKSGEQVRLTWPHRSSFTRYTFDHLAHEILPLERDVLISLTAERARRRAAGHASGAPSIHLTAATWWEAVLTDLQRLRQHRWNGQLPPGHRDAWLFLACTAMTHLVPLQALRRECYALAQEAGSTWTDHETDSRMSTVYRRAAAAARGETLNWNGEVIDPRYRFRASTIVEWLGVTPAEMRDAGLRAIINADLRRQLATEREKARRRRLGVVDREEYRAEVQAGSAKATRPWEALGMSRATWYRKGKPSSTT